VDKGSDQLVFHHFLSQLVLIWVAMKDFLVFSAITSSSWSFRPLPHLLCHFAAAGAAADRSVIEFAVDRWVIRRGPLGNLPWTTGQCGGPASFLLSCS
jgi:hypothetical protein